MIIAAIATVLVLFLCCRCARGLSPKRQRYLLEAAAQVATAQRLRIFGCCAAGKSQLRVSLGKMLQLPLVEMDTIYWKPGWVMRDHEDTLGMLAERLGDAWILDGNFMSKPRDLERYELNRQIWDSTQCLIWLDYPFWTIYLRAWRRTLWRIGTGEPCCNGNRETWSLLLCDFRNSIPYFVWTGHGKFPERLQELERIFEERIDFVHLQSQRETDFFLNSIAKIAS